MPSQAQESAHNIRHELSQLFQDWSWMNCCNYSREYFCNYVAHTPFPLTNHTVVLRVPLIPSFFFAPCKSSASERHRYCLRKPQSPPLHFELERIEEVWYVSRVDLLRRTANTYSFLLLNDKIICVCRIRSGCEPVANHVSAVFPFGPRRVGVEFDSWHRKRDYFFRFPIRPSPPPRPQPSSPLPTDDGGRRKEGEGEGRRDRQ